ncbi:MAG TPA: (d)CMP kinase [Egibacteraceae bacterium]|nr:(d)CMP kinase [Egibacteraceae bacterium]
MADGPLIVTIDGPAASGKSSVARGVASSLGVPYLSSGLLYRLVAVAALAGNVDPTSEAALASLLARHDLRLVPDPAGNRVLLDGRDVTDETSSSRVDETVSRVAQHPRVRQWVNESLKRLPGPFVAEGRDMGAAVFPEAPVKLYLTASSRVRAVRRSRERPEDTDAIEAAIVERDARDAVNSRPAPDAVTLDSSELNLEQVIDRALDEVRRRIG